KSLQVPQASPPTFLFLLIFNCQKTDRSMQSQNQTPKAKSPWKTTSIQLINLISLERKTSSPAAPPPSFSERTYKRSPSNKSTAQIRKTQKNIQITEYKREFRFSAVVDGEWSANPADFAQEKGVLNDTAGAAPCFSPLPR
ncbi:hypothetical protein, partial [Agrobacterium fabrum]